MTPSSYNIILDLAMSDDEQRDAFFTAVMSRFPHHLPENLSIMIWSTPSNLLHIDNMAYTILVPHPSVLKMSSAHPNEGYREPTG